MATWGPTSIQAGLDDGYERVDNSTWYGTPTYAYIGVTSTPWVWHTGLRWDAVTVPQGATIDSAYITINWNGSAHYGAAVCNVQAWDSDDADQFDETNRPSTVTKTTAAVEWTIADPNTHPEVKTSPDIKSVVQEIVDREGWASGNAINFALINTETGDKYGTIDVYETESGTVATLTITYTESAATNVVMNII